MIESILIDDSLLRLDTRWKPYAATIAGGNGKGNRLTQLSHPQGILVDQFDNIYIADRGNDRVICWCDGAKEGRIVVGGNGKGIQANQLNYPDGLSTDNEGNLYVSDRWNYRIQKFDREYFP